MLKAGEVLIEQKNDFFFEVGRIFGKRMYFDFIDNPDHKTAIGHSHKYDHVHLLAYGKLEVEVDGVSKIYEAPAMINIEAGKNHKMTALVDKTIGYCIHDTHGMPIDDLGEKYIG